MIFYAGDVWKIPLFLKCDKLFLIKRLTNHQIPILENRIKKMYFYVSVIKPSPKASIDTIPYFQDLGNRNKG